jgi:hypothetical protein
MKLSPADIKRLYGERFFLVPEPEAREEKVVLPNEPEEKEPQTPEIQVDRDFEQGPAVIWKMRAKAKLAIVLRQKEFHDRSLTNVLKQAIVDAGIDTQMIGFGVMEDEDQACNLSDMTVDLALVCDHLQSDWADMPVFLQQKQLWITSNLREIVESKALQQQLAAYLQAIGHSL